MDSNDKTDNVVYKAKVKTPSDGKSETYVGLTADPFKIRYGGHLQAFNHEKYSQKSNLSKYIWKLKKQNLQFSIDWKILDRGKPFSPDSNTCQLCTKEKFHIILNKDSASLNSREELFNHCRHKEALLL